MEGHLRMKRSRVRKPTQESLEHLCLNKGYDNMMAQEVVAKHAYIPHIRRIGE